MYNPYEEMLRRRQQYPETPVTQQPAPVAALPTYSGPELMPWMPDDSQQANESAGAAGAGMGALLSRFKKPKVSGLASGAGGALSG